MASVRGTGRARSYRVVDQMSASDDDYTDFWGVGHALKRLFSVYSSEPLSRRILRRAGMFATTDVMFPCSDNPSRIFFFSLGERDAEAFGMFTGRWFSESFLKVGNVLRPSTSVGTDRPCNPRVTRIQADCLGDGTMVCVGPGLV